MATSIEDASEIELMPENPPSSLPIAKESAIQPAQTTTTTTTVLDENGDLHLRVGRPKPELSSHPRKAFKMCRTFKVCSRALARHSSVFQMMLYGPFRESKPDPAAEDSSMQWLVHLPDDKPGAMALLLNIVHGHFRQVPDNLPPAPLFQLTILTDKYDMTGVLRPWLDRWADHLQMYLPSPPSHPGWEETLPTHLGSEEILWISWELGLDSVFEKSVDYLLRHCKADPDTGQLFWEEQSGAGCPVVDDWVYLGVVDILDSIKQIRSEAIENALAALQKQLDALLQPPEESCSCRRVSEQNYNRWDSSHCPICCRSWMLGSLIGECTRRGLYPVPTASDWEESLDSLRIILLSISEFKVNLNCACGHLKDLEDELNKAFGMPPAVQEKHRDHLQRQKAKTQ